MASFSWPLSLPASGGTGGTAQQTQVQIQLDRKLGTDIFFNGDYVVSDAGDYLLVSGIENLKASIYRRLITRPGEYVFVPEYGVGIQDFVKKPKTLPVIDQLKARIQSNLLRDIRIQAVEDIEVQNTDNSLTIILKIQAEGRTLLFRPFTFTEAG